MRSKREAWGELWIPFGLALGLTYLVFWVPLAVFGLPAASPLLRLWVTGF